MPETNRFEITGRVKDNVFVAKDVILNVIGRVGADISTAQACEFAGETVQIWAFLKCKEWVLTNMAIEMGGKTGFSRSR